MNTVENDYIKFWIENEILFSVYKKEIQITLDNAKEVIQLRHDVSNQKKQYWCYNLNGLKSMSKEGRDYVEMHGQELLYATAVVINSHITQFLFNAFLKLKKPKVAMKVFTNNENAIAWLTEMKQKNKNTDQ